MDPLLRFHRRAPTRTGAASVPHLLRACRPRRWRAAGDAMQLQRQHETHTREVSPRLPASQQHPRALPDLSLCFSRPHPARPHHVGISCSPGRCGGDVVRNRGSFWNGSRPGAAEEAGYPAAAAVHASSITSVCCWHSAGSHWFCGECCGAPPTPPPALSNNQFIVNYMQHG